MLRHLLCGELLLENSLTVLGEVRNRPFVESVKLSCLFVRQVEIQGLAAGVLVIPGARAKRRCTRLQTTAQREVDALPVLILELA